MTNTAPEKNTTYYAVEFFNNSSLCHNAVATAEEAMETLDKMRQTVSENQQITMSITGYVAAADAEKTSREDRGLANQNA